MGKHSKSAHKTSLTVIVLLILMIVALAAVCVWAIFFRDSGSDILPPDYAPMEEESNATDIEGDVSTKLEAPEGGGAIGLTYSDTVTVDLSDGTVKMLFQNPGRSLNNMILQVFVQDTLLAQSDLLVPGKQLNQLPLNKNAVSKLQPGGYKGQFVVSIYNPDTGEKSMVDAQVEITVVVTE